MKVNPDSVVLEQLDDQWQKVAAFILWKTVGRSGAVRVTLEDMKALEAAFAPGIPVIFTHGQHDAFEFSLVTEDRAKALAAHDATMRGAA